VNNPILGSTTPCCLLVKLPHRNFCSMSQRKEQGSRPSSKKETLFEKCYRSLSVDALACRCYPVPKIVKYSDVTYTIPPDALYVLHENVSSALPRYVSPFCGSRTKLPAFRSSNPERGGVTGLPIVPLSVERFKPPPLPGPVSSHGTVAVVDFCHQLRHWFPA
jgi:hypothetical protein